MSFVMTDEFSVAITKITSRIGLVSYELTIYLSVFGQFKLNEIWPFYQKNVNHLILNCKTL